MEEAADLLYGLLSPELYLLFAKERGRAGERWERRRMRPGRPERRVVGFTRVENRTESYIETQTSCGLASEQNMSGRRPEDRLLPVLRRWAVRYSCSVVLIPVARSERLGVERAEHATEVGAHLFLFLGQERFQGLLLARFERSLALQCQGLARGRDAHFDDLSVRGVGTPLDQSTLDQTPQRCAHGLCGDAAPAGEFGTGQRPVQAQSDERAELRLGQSEGRNARSKRCVYACEICQIR